MHNPGLPSWDIQVSTPNSSGLGAFLFLPEVPIVYCHSTELVQGCAVL